MSSTGAALRSLEREDEEGGSSPGGRPWGQPSHEVQRLWFELLRRDWKTLGIVSVGASGASLEVANALAEVGGIHGHRAVMLVDAVALELKQVSKALAEISAEVAQGERVLVALGSVLENLAGIPVARACDAVLLCVELGRDGVDAGRKAIQLVDPGRVVGAVVFHGGAR